MDRRRFLAAVGASASVGLAGCGGDGGNSGASGGADGGTTTAAPTVDEHPAAADLTDQPVLGSTEGHVVVAFEDPSCPTCARFHGQVLPKLRENLVDPGKGAFVFRTYPILSYAWNEPAAAALEATFDRDASAFWRLLDHVYATQGRFEESNVLDRVADFLADETDLEGGAVTDAVAAGEYEDAVQADLDAAAAGEIGRATPTILLFRDGRYATTIPRQADYDVIAGTLDL